MIDQVPPELLDWHYRSGPGRATIAKLDRILARADPALQAGASPLEVVAALRRLAAAGDAEAAELLVGTEELDRPN